MTGEIVPFPAPPPRVPRSGSGAAGVAGLRPGDLVVVCINSTLNLWCAWPVALIDDDGWVVAVHQPGGRVVGVDRLNSAPDVYGFRAGDHQDGAFADLAWKTWRSAQEALAAFAGVAVAPTGGAA